MMKTSVKKPVNTKSLVIILMIAVLMVVATVVGFSATAEGGEAYNNKLIARYALNETSGTTIAAVDKDGEPAASFDATVSGSISTADGMTGAATVRFNNRNLTVPKEVFADLNGFSFSMWIKTGTLDDWGSQLLQNSSGQLFLTLPNIDVWALYATNANPYAHSTLHNAVGHIDFLPGNSFAHVAITVNSVGITYYVNGIKGIEYEYAKFLGNGTTSIGTVVDKILSDAKSGGLRFFAAAFPAVDDFRISQALTDAEIAALYADSAYGVTNIKATVDGTTKSIKSFNYANVMAPVPSTHADYTVNYLKDAGDDADANKPSISFDVSKIASGLTRALTADVLVSGTDFMATVVTSDPTEVGSTTVYNETWTISAGKWSKVIVVKFERDNDLAAAMGKLTNISVSGATISGFNSSTLNYTYTLTPDIAAIPEVTYIAAVPASVDITTNKNDSFDGIQFVYSIKIFDKTAQAGDPELAEYTITFNRQRSDIITSVIIGGDTIGNFVNSTESIEDGSTNRQTAYVSTKVSTGEESKVGVVFSYPTAARIEVTIDSSDIIIVKVIDTISNLSKFYAFTQVNSYSSAYNFNFNSSSFASKTGSTFYDVGFEDPANKVTLSNADAAGVDLNDDYLKFGTNTQARIMRTGTGGLIGSNAEDAVINPQGFTVATWMRMSGSATSEWAGVLSIGGKTSAATPGDTTLVANIGGFINGNLSTGWVNSGSNATPATGLVSDSWVHIAMVIAGNGYAAYYINGRMVRAVTNHTMSLASGKTTYENLNIRIGRTHASANDLLGPNGYYKSLTIYNAPLPQSTVYSLYEESEAGMLKTLKITDEASNINGFSSRAFDYPNIAYAYSGGTISEDSFPTLAATNMLDQDVANITVKFDDGTGNYVSDTYVSGNKAKYTIVSDVGGFAFVYTVTLTLASSNSQMASAAISYTGAYANINDSLDFDDFAPYGSSGDVWSYTYKVWTGCITSALEINFVGADPSSQRVEGDLTNAMLYTARIYAEDQSYSTYMIVFETDATITSPDERQTFVLLSAQTATITKAETYTLEVDYPSTFSFGQRIKAGYSDVASIARYQGSNKVFTVTPKTSGTFIIELLQNPASATPTVIKEVTITIVLAGLEVSSAKTATITLEQSYTLVVDYPVGYNFQYSATAATQDNAEIVAVAGKNNREFTILPLQVGTFVIELKEGTTVKETITITITEVPTFTVISSKTPSILTSETYTLEVDFSAGYVFTVTIKSGADCATLTAATGTDKKFIVAPTKAGTVVLEIKSGDTLIETITVTISDPPAPDTDKKKCGGTLAPESGFDIMGGILVLCAAAFVVVFLMKRKSSTK